MNAQTLLEYQWPYLLSFFPEESQLQASAQEKKALQRRRAVDSAGVLLRLAMAYGFCGLSLRQTAAWAQAAQIASISDVGLLKRLRQGSDWLGHLLGIKLAERAGVATSFPQNMRLRLVDATCINRPGVSGIDWRVHLGFNLSTLSIDHAEVTDSSLGETLTRFPVDAGDIVIGDRGYAHRAGLAAVRRAGGDFIVRLNLQNVPLQHSDGSAFDLLAALRSLPDAAPGGFWVRTSPDRRAGLSSFSARLVAIRKTEAAAQQSRTDLLRERGSKGQVHPTTLEAAGYLFVLSSVHSDRLSDAQILELYRFRWQIELAFKRLKSLLHLDVLPAKDPRLTRTIIYTKLLAALLLDDFTERFLAISPWGFPLSSTALPLAHPARSL